MILETWDVRPGEKVADFGCGAGFFSVPIAQRLGQYGAVYAFDIRQEALDATRSKTKLFHITTVDLVRADLERPRGSGLADSSVDKILIANILFQSDAPGSILAEAYRIVKPGGTVLIVEWDEETVGGPVLPKKIARKTIEDMFAQIGFSRVKDFYAGSHHYGLIFKKPA